MEHERYRKVLKEKQLLDCEESYMGNGKMKVVIIDESETRRNQIKGYMPLYMEAFCEPYGDKAKNQIMPAADGRVTELVIMNADDSKGHGLYMFDWMKHEEKGLNLDQIPVILLMSDMFSDRALEFLELGDAEFYEGELDADRLYSVIMQTFERLELGPEPKSEPVLYTEDRSFDKISGLSIRPEGDESNKRCMVLGLEEQQRHLAMALERGQKRRELLKELMESALRLKEEKNASEKAVNEMGLKAQTMPPFQPVQQRQTSQQFKQPVQEIPQSSVYAATSYQQNQSRKQTIVIIDHDSRNLKICELFLSSRYDVVKVESGMQAIDYFVHSKAELILINYNMPVLDGVKILSSIRWQPNGKYVPAVFMAEGDLNALKSKCNQERVIGLLQLPITKTALVNAVDLALLRKK